MGNLPEFKLLASAALELATPIKFQNLRDSCRILLHHPVLGTFVPNNGFVRTPFAGLCANISDKVVFSTSKKIFGNSSFILAISLAD